MQFGVFDHMDRAGNDLMAQYEDRLSLIETYDRAGFRGYHLAEHHSTPLGQSPSPSVFLAAASQRTKKIRLGAMVFTLSLYHPLRLIEEICMLDMLTRGRLDVGIGRGISPIEMGFYGVHGDKAQEVYLEASEIILQGLTSPRVNYEGKHFTFRDVPMELAPVQKPLPPMWYGVARPETTVWAAQNNFNIMCNGPISIVAEITSRFRSEWAGAGNPASSLPLMGMSRHVVVADTDAEAIAVAAPAYEQWHGNLTYLWKLNRMQVPLSFPEKFEDAVRMGLCCVGSTSTVRAMLQEQAGEAGVNYLLCRLAFGNLKREQSMRTVELMARDIMPAFEPVALAV